ncbi:sensor histidine kinase [Paenibacillus rigui]|uniref:histidine kinase n=2 Tax=Paenibacillus rigui TaxID=554312 RepID=A0A229UUV5_9BACL|nr:sensor histidine kinase [Paenibacillus rigui]OXM86699.1 sensor histidine kinase [Paenibacillus rigui]
MLAGFVSVMVIVLVCAGIITFNSVSTLLKNKAEGQMKQTVNQANGRLEALIHQIDTLTLQAVNDSNLQRLMLASASGEGISFSERQSLLQTANQIQSYTSGVTSVEVYSRMYSRLFPLDEQSLSDKLNMAWIERADQEMGKLVWIGIDPKDTESVLAIRRINLVDRWFSNGGYLLIRMNRTYFEFKDPQTNGQERMLLADSAARPIVADGAGITDLSGLQQTGSQSVEFGQQRYILVKQTSEETGWTLLILYPESDITEGISTLRLAVVAAGAIGFVLFVIMSFLLSTMITRPILRLMKAMRNTRQGVLTPNPSIAYTTELNDLNTTYNQMVDSMNHLIKLVYEKEILQSRTELQALQAQINPHFLYNTLEALYWSLQGKDEEELADLVVAMSDLFRYVISSPSKDEWVTVGEELEHIEHYLRIMGIRFGDRLAWRIEAEDGYRSIRMPKLLIQPLVENAILHGLEGKIGQGLVTVQVELSSAEAPALRVSVCDDGPGIDDSTLQAILESNQPGRASSGKRTGMGISNVKRRIQLYYSAESSCGLTINSKIGQGTCVHLELPILEEG